MSNQKISELTALPGEAAESTDIIPIVDLSAGAAGSKKITVAELAEAVVTNSTVQAALAADPAGARTALGIPTYATLALANAALANGDLFFNSTSGKYETATA